MESRAFKCEGERNDHTLHHELVFGNVFESRESKCCAVLMKYHKVKDEQVITFQMAQQLKTKNVNVVPGQLLAQRYCTFALSYPLFLLMILVQNFMLIKNHIETWV